MFDWEPLLDDERVGRVGDLIRLAYPQLGSDAQIFTAIVPAQVDHKGETPRVIPEQAVFFIKTPHPRSSFDPFYKGKELMSQAGMWYTTWAREEKDRRHYVSAREDPAFGVYEIVAREHVKKMSNLRQLI